MLGLLTSSFAPFWESDRVTHTEDLTKFLTDFSRVIGGVNSVAEEQEEEHRFLGVRMKDYKYRKESN